MDGNSDTTINYEAFGDNEFDAFVEDTLKEFLTPGMAVLVVHGDRTMAKGYGLSDIEREINVTPETLFQTGSTTKSFTAAMAAHLVESPEFPLISWTTPLADLISDDFVLDQSTPEGLWANKRITLEDALSHRTGMSRHDMVWINGDPTPREIVRSLRHLPMHRELRAKWEYNNTMFTAVSHAVETRLHQPFGQLLKQHIFDPLSMHRTTYTVADALDTAKRDAVTFANGYIWDDLQKRYHQIPHSDIAPSKGSGGIISTVLDYSHWVRHLMVPRDLNYALSKNAVKEMRLPRSLPEPDAYKPYVGPQAYCLGLYSQVYRGRELIQHAGASPGHMSTMIVVPPKIMDEKDDRQENGLAIVIMQNTWSLAQDIVTWHFLDKYLGTPERERFDMAGADRKTKAKKEELMKTESVPGRLSGSSLVDQVLNPTLALQKYEGVYSHVTYHEFRVSVMPSSKKTSHGPAHESAKSDSNSQIKNTSHSLLLKPSGTQKTYFDLSAALNHVTGDWWWAHRTMGPSCWLTDEALKVHFIVANDGTVKGMELQTEPAMPSTLALFSKVC